MPWVEMNHDMKIPRCHYCQIEMACAESDTNGYEMWRCQKCSHKVYKVVDGVRVIRNKLVDKNGKTTDSIRRD